LVIENERDPPLQADTIGLRLKHAETPQRLVVLRG
jgi:hypothetical protein